MPKRWIHTAWMRTSSVLRIRSVCKWNLLGPLLYTVYYSNRPSTNPSYILIARTPSWHFAKEIPSSSHQRQHLGSRPRKWLAKGDYEALESSWGYIHHWLTSYIIPACCISHKSDMWVRCSWVCCSWVILTSIHLRHFASLLPYMPSEVYTRSASSSITA